MNKDVWDQNASMRSRAPAPQKKSQETLVQDQLRALPTYEPRFIKIMTFIQFAVIVYVMETC